MYDAGEKNIVIKKSKLSLKSISWVQALEFVPEKLLTVALPLPARQYELRH
jgi:hypothetical protein